MKDYRFIGKDTFRKEGWNKVTGRAQYIDDENEMGTLHAKLLTSSYAHAYIDQIDTLEAMGMPGVHAILTGADYKYLVGSTIVDRPILAYEKVRYFGEPIAIVIADTEAIAEKALQVIQVKYTKLQIVQSPLQAYKDNSVLVHEELSPYRKRETGIQSEPGTNIANKTKICKGDVQTGFNTSDIIIESEFNIPMSDHMAMETRCVKAEIKPDGDVFIFSTSQAPFEIKKQLSETFQLDENKVHVYVPLVGGGYGGKVAVQLEYLAYIASQAVEGRRVKLHNSREEDIVTSPGRVGLHATVKMGVTKEGKLQAVELFYLFEGGAYADKSINVSKSAALAGIGPYSLENLSCDSLCMYTNHPYATASRGFGHTESTFVIERALDIIAQKLNMCPIELRLKNIIQPGDTTPSQVVVNKSTIGDPVSCLLRLKEIIKNDNGWYTEHSNGKVHATGISMGWKSSTTPTDASAGAVLTFNADGSVNINCAAIEIGQGAKTVLAQIVAEKMKMDITDVHIKMEVDTQVAPHHWETAASRTTYLAGNAVIAATEDAIKQLKQTASTLLGYPVEKLVMANKKISVDGFPNATVDFSKIVLGYVNPKGEVIGFPVVGRGTFIFKGLTDIDAKTGKGNAGPDWGVVAQAVEVELDLRDYTYKIIRAVSVVDAGKVLNQKTAMGQIMGGMSMGLSMASREGFLYDKNGKILNPQFRSYKVLHYGEQPEYIVDFIETPCEGAPFGARSLGENGMIGMYAALANSISIAADVSIHTLPITPESLWKAKQEGRSYSDDTF
ncbi:aldehyde oxidase [Bacillus cereus]|uniref:Aldehyde oxidase n=1 Tax=Bacillus cereus TaxID=1396 RepID=A0A9X6U5X5_BACCE|nr:xanthine dehydrogenase family protein molybdopterin-binding subunit [Bacillus cereus]PEN78894.1 aldehyde oxidase [Bacillus cereus]